MASRFIKKIRKSKIQAPWVSKVELPEFSVEPGTHPFITYLFLLSYGMPMLGERKWISSSLRTTPGSPKLCRHPSAAHSLALTTDQKVRASAGGGSIKDAQKVQGDLESRGNCGNTNKQKTDCNSKICWKPNTSKTILDYFQAIRTFMQKNYSCKCFLCLPQASISVHDKLQGFPSYISRLHNLARLTVERLVVSFLPNIVISSSGF